MKRIWTMGLALVLAGASFAACDSSSSGNGDTTNTGTQPTADEVKGCKAACEQLKFFECNDAADQATCYGNCGDADSAQIELFVACVTNDTCDPECSPYLTANTEPNPPEGTECTKACDAVNAAGCLTADQVLICKSVCAMGNADQKAFLVSCVAQRSGCVFPEACTTAFSEGPDGDTVDPSDDIVEPVAAPCKEACDTMKFYNCFTAQDLENCWELCDSLDQGKKDSFESCVNNGICTDDQCYKILNPQGAQGDVAGCQSSCDDMNFFDCLSAEELSACRALCSTASKDSIETFKACAMGACDGPDCYYSMAQSNP